MFDFDPKKPAKVWWIFMIQVSLVVGFFVIGLYLGVYLRDRELIQEQILTNARAHHQNIIVARMWNAMHGGVYVEKKGKITANPFLEGGDVVAEDGRVFALRNPAIMTREMADLAEQKGDFKYRITSLDPLNPANAPDEFERRALQAFDDGLTELHGEMEKDGRTHFRYMAPLMTTQDCLPCHAKQGYQVGDVRGGISVAMDVTDIKSALVVNQGILLGLIVATTCLVLATFVFFTLRLMRQLKLAHAVIEELAATDELTHVPNRRTFFERFEEEVERARRYDANLSLVMLDIDHFKQVNDVYGHPAGDMVLHEVARLLSANIRSTDLLARYGGEEFAILIPAVAMGEAQRVAEKLRTVVEVNDIAMEGPSLKVTVSAGVADVNAVRGDEGLLKDNLLQAADDALLRAKRHGRNRVECFSRSAQQQHSLF